MSNPVPSTTDKVKGLLHHAGTGVMAFGAKRSLIAAPAVSAVLAGVTGGNIMAAVPYACATACVALLVASESAANLGSFKNAISQSRAETLKTKGGWAIGLVLPAMIGFGASHDFNFNANRLLAPIVSDGKALGSKFNSFSIKNGADGKKVTLVTTPPASFRPVAAGR